MGGGSYDAVARDNRCSGAVLGGNTTVRRILLPLKTWKHRDGLSGGPQRDGPEPAPEGFGKLFVEN